MSLFYSLRSEIDSLLSDKPVRVSKLTNSRRYAFVMSSEEDGQVHRSPNEGLTCIIVYSMGILTYRGRWCYSFDKLVAEPARKREACRSSTRPGRLVTRRYYWKPEVAQ